MQKRISTEGGIENCLDLLLSRDEETLNKFILDSLEFKKNYVENDEFDKNERVLLNYGHTFGHAFEVTSNFKIPHGTAVALGMVIANFISVIRYSVELKIIEKIENLVHKIIEIELKDEWFEMSLLMSAILKDKKQLGSGINAILLQRDLSLKRVNDVTEQQINDALHHLRKHFV